jgi:MFS family permease
MSEYTFQNRPYLIFAVCFLSVAFGAMDSVLASAYLPNITRDLTGGAGDGATGMVGSWLSFCFLLGGAGGGILMGFLSDKLGRKKALVIGLLSYGAGSGLGAFASSWPLLAFMRILIGAGVGTALVITAVIISEHWLPRTRAVALGILWETGVWHSV